MIKSLHPVRHAAPGGADRARAADHRTSRGSRWPRSTGTWQQLDPGAPAGPGGHPRPDAARTTARRPCTRCTRSWRARGRGRATPTTRRNWARYDLIWPHLSPSEVVELRRRGSPPAAHRPGALPVEARRLRGGARGGAPARAAVAGQDRAGRRADARPCASTSRTCCARRAASRRPTSWTPRSSPSSGSCSATTTRSTLLTAGSLGGDLRGLGRFREALSSTRRPTSRNRDLLGADDPNTLSSANNLAVDLRLVGDSSGPATSTRRR